MLLNPPTQYVCVHQHYTVLQKLLIELNLYQTRDFTSTVTVLK